MSFFIHDALAASTTAAVPQGSGISNIIMMAALLGVFYLLFWLPQSKRVKQQRQLINSLAKGDEVITNGGILGRIVKVTDDFVVLAIADNVEILVQKMAISASVPKGTLKSVN